MNREGKTSILHIKHIFFHFHNKRIQKHMLHFSRMLQIFSVAKSFEPKRKVSKEFCRILQMLSLVQEYCRIQDYKILRIKRVSIFTYWIRAINILKFYFRFHEDALTNSFKDNLDLDLHQTLWLFLSWSESKLFLCMYHMFLHIYLHVFYCTCIYYFAYVDV